MRITCFMFWEAQSQPEVHLPFGMPSAMRHSGIDPPVLRVCEINVFERVLDKLFRTVLRREREIDIRLVQRDIVILNQSQTDLTIEFEVIVVRDTLGSISKELFFFCFLGTSSKEIS